MSENNDKETGDLIHNGKGNKLLPNHRFFKVVLAAVDADQELEKVKEDIKSIVEYICDYKDECTQVIVVGCSNTIDIPSLALSNYVSGIEISSTPNKWGTKHNISFSEQFLGFFPLPIDREKHDLCKSIMRSVAICDDIQKRSVYYKEHPIASGIIGLAGLGTVVGIGYGIYKGVKKFINKKPAVKTKSLEKVKNLV